MNSDIKLIWELMPDWIHNQPDGLSEEFYGTGSKTGDELLADKIKHILGVDV